MKIGFKFIDDSPAEIEEKVLYISLKHNIIIHSCFCGCKEKVVLPLNPNYWNFTYDGETISLSPSVGNFQLKCKSHYWVRKSNVVMIPKKSSIKINKFIKWLDY